MNLEKQREALIQLTSKKEFDFEELKELRDSYNEKGKDSKHREHVASKVMNMLDDILEELTK